MQYFDLIICIFCVIAFLLFLSSYINLLCGDDSYKYKIDFGSLFLVIAMILRILQMRGFHI